MFVLETESVPVRGNHDKRRDELFDDNRDVNPVLERVSKDNKVTMTHFVLGRSSRKRCSRMGRTY